MDGCLIGWVTPGLAKSCEPDTPALSQVRINSLPNEPVNRVMEREKKDFLSVRRMPRDSFERRKSGNRSIQGRVEQLACERDGDLPVWVRAPKCGREFYSGCSRPKLYEWAAKGHIRSVSIREPGRIKGVRLFRLASILEFIETLPYSVTPAVFLNCKNIQTSCIHWIFLGLVPMVGLEPTRLFIVPGF